MAQPLAGTSKPVVLFFCTGSSARSQMAEGLLRAKAGDRFEVLSAGTHPRPLRGEALEVMRELAIDISGQRSKSVDEYLGTVAIDHLITLSDIANAERRELPLVRRHLHWSIEDPALAQGNYFERLGVFRRLRDELAARIDHFLAMEPPSPAGGESVPMPDVDPVDPPGRGRLAWTG